MEVWRLRGPGVIPARDLVVVLEVVDVPLAGLDGGLPIWRRLDAVLDPLELYVLGRMRQGCDAPVEPIEGRRIGGFRVDGLSGEDENRGLADIDDFVI